MCEPAKNSAEHEEKNEQFSESSYNIEVDRSALRLPTKGELAVAVALEPDDFEVVLPSTPAEGENGGCQEDDGGVDGVGHGLGFQVVHRRKHSDSMASSDEGECDQGQVVHGSMGVDVVLAGTVLAWRASKELMQRRQLCSLVAGTSP